VGVTTPTLGRLLEGWSKPPNVCAVMQVAAATGATLGLFLPGNTIPGKPLASSVEAFEACLALGRDGSGGPGS
jgi:hypothetical protein